MSDKPILFYSPNCKFSVSLWNKLKQKNILDSITKINVSTTPVPAYIKSVPTLKVKDRPLLQGSAIEMFFNSFTSNVVKASPTKQVTDNTTSSIQEYMPCEMGNCWSDAYSYIGTDNPINHSYSFLGDTNVGIPPTTTVKGGLDDSSMNTKKDDFSRKLEQLKSARDTDLSNSRM